MPLKLNTSRLPMSINQKLTHLIQNRVVQKARLEDQILRLDFTDGSNMQIKLEHPASLVMVRDGGGSWSMPIDLALAARPRDRHK
jgi:hypothetical protein